MNYLHEQRIKENTLLGRLQEYAASDAYPFHMPGHKRNKLEEEKLGNFPEPFSIDITEIYGFDDLHHPEGILKASMEKTAEIYGAISGKWEQLRNFGSGKRMYRKRRKNPDQPELP